MYIKLSIIFNWAILFARSSTTTLPNAFPPSEKIKPNLPTCGICNKFFATYLALKNHNNTHNLCALPTTSQNSLPSEQIKPNLPTCDICNKFFATYRALKKHNKTHDLWAVPTTSQNSLPSEQIKPNLPSCEPCNKFFSGYRALKEHNKTHGYMKSCNICSKTFKFACQLKLHIQIHDKARPKLFCNLCSFSTLRKDSLLTHRRTHMIENLYVCDICRKGFHRIGYLVKHLKVHAGKEPLKCDICGLTFLLRNKLSYHKKNVHKKSTKILCTLCNKECANQFKWRQHMHFETMCTGTMDIETITIKSEIFPINEPTDMGVNEEDNLDSYSTEDPKFSKTSINNVKLLTNPIIKVSQTGSSIYTTTTLLNSFPARKIKPKLSYSEVSNNIFTTKRVSCDVCFKSFRYASRLKLHMQTHSKERPELFCDLCSFSTLRKDSLSKHRKRHINENLYVCDICKRSFNERSDLVEHLNVHAGKEPYQCDICGLSFLLGSKLSYHRKIMHGNSGKISCAHCDKEFVHHFEWKMHMQGHKKKKLYTCDYCSRTFTTKNVLKIHIAVHMNIKSFPCKFCSLSFNTGQLLKLHTYSHMAKKPYMCKKCDQTFIQHSAFEAHVNFHTGKRPYTCHICSKGFVRIIRQQNQFHFLTKHYMKTHLRYSPYICGKGVRSNVSSQNHKAIQMNKQS
uniref:C2H2-type domain-containing protein n=1 Tax=Timema monikensis TaxID=170555 RepID=A0A7R9HIC5_9NEOP|nr:unnamed protein product [Timema monikensis]